MCGCVRALCLWGEPPKYSGRGKPRVHGDKFKLNDSSTWGEPAQIIEEEDNQIGRVRIRVWHSLHFRKAPNHSMSIILVERLNPDGSPRISKPMWLANACEQMPPSSEIWKLYLRRFAVDHWYRFARAAVTLDASQTFYSKTMRPLERSHATDDLGVVACS